MFLRMANLPNISVRNLGQKFFIFRFAGKLISSGSLVLLTVNFTPGSTSGSAIVNCEKISIASLLAKEVTVALSRT